MAGNTGEPGSAGAGREAADGAGAPDGGGQAKGSQGQAAGLAQAFGVGPETAGAGRDAGADGAGEPDGGGQAKGDQGQARQGGIAMPGWAEQLPKAMLADRKAAEKLAGFKTPGDLAKAYLDLEAKGSQGQAVIPTEHSTPEEVRAFYESLGKPKEAKGYPFAAGDPAFAEAAFAANLSAGQAEALYKASLARMDGARRQVQSALAQELEATDALLRKEHGERYGEAVALLHRGLGNNPATGEFSPLAKALADAGLAGKPEIVRAFIELGRATSEGASGGGTAAAGRPQSITEGRGFKY